MNYICNPDRPNSGFGLGVVVNEGSVAYPRWKPAPLFRDPATGQIWVAGVPGQSFGVEFIVPDSGRYKAVASIDGLNIMTGDPSAGDHSERAWVINRAAAPGANVIPGWYRDSGTVADFVFSDDAFSYSNLSGQGTANTGVIAVRYFYERRQGFCGTTRRGGLETLSAAPKGLGTGYGEDHDFQSSTTTFNVDTARAPYEVVLRYNTAANLRAAGFQEVTKPQGSDSNPFPKGPSGTKPPQGYNPHRRGGS